MKTRVKTTILKDGKKEVGKLEARLRAKFQQIKDLKDKAKGHFDDDSKAEDLYEHQKRGIGRYLAVARRKEDEEVRAVYDCRSDGLYLHTSQGWLEVDVSGRRLSLEAEGHERFINDFYKLLIQQA